jgi:hypothetical protein
MTAVIVSNDRPYSTKVVLHCPDGYRMELDRMVEDFVADGVPFVGVAGADCARVEDIIDEIVVGDGSDDTRVVLTSSHPDESVEEVVEFAKSLLLPEYAGDIQIVCLPR